MSELYQRCKKIVDSGREGDNTLLDIKDCQMVMDLHDQREAQQNKINELESQIDFKIKECQELAQACNRWKNQTLGNG